MIRSDKLQILHQVTKHNENVKNEIDSLAAAIGQISNLMMKYQTELLFENKVMSKNGYLVGEGWQKLYHAYNYLESQVSETSKYRIRLA